MIGTQGHLSYDPRDGIIDQSRRNGFGKIVLLIAHRGNRHLAPFFVQLMLEKQKDYAVYLPEMLGDLDAAQSIREVIETEFDYHGGEMGTSLILAIYPERVNMDQIDETSGGALRRLEHLPGVETPVSWFADFPDHRAGDAHPDSADTPLRQCTRRRVEFPHGLAGV